MLNKMVGLVVLLGSFGFSFFAVSALHIEHLFKKNSTMQIQLFYILVSMGLAYLVTQFLYMLIL